MNKFQDKKIGRGDISQDLPYFQILYVPSITPDYIFISYFLNLNIFNYIIKRDLTRCLIVKSNIRIKAW